MPASTDRYEIAVARCFEAWNAREPQEPARSPPRGPRSGATPTMASESEGSAPVAGSDVITVDAEGRITSILGFPDRVPAGP